MRDVAQFKGGEKSVRRAPITFQWLVKLAEAGRNIEYGELAKLVGVHHRNVDKILGVIGHAIDDTNLGFGNIPPIQLLVVNKKTAVPGDSGMRWLIKGDEQRAKLSLQARRALCDGTQQEIFKWAHWRELLAALGVEPLALGSLPLKELVSLIETAVPYGAEGEDHLRLKEYVARNPSVIQLPLSVPPGKMEAIMLSGDRMDVFFELPEQWICAEVKGKQSGEADILRGIFQCVKYKAVLEAQRHYLKADKLPNVRVVLVLAGTLPDSLESVTKVLGIEVISDVIVPASFTASAS